MTKKLKNNNMAVNDKENPEEGTPRSKSDIREERRKMKSINRQRKAMGGDVLYKPEDFEEIKKPYKGGPGETSRAVVAEETKPDVEYIKAGYGDPNQGSGEVRAVFKGGTEQAEEIRKDSDIGKKIAETIEQTSLNDNTKTLNQKQQDLSIAKTVEDNIENTNNAINKQVQEQVKKEEAIGGSGQNIAKITESVEPGKVDWTLSEPAIEFSPTSRESINEQARLAKSKVPKLAIEKLGVQDYYPEIGRDIAVGTFTGSRIGSQTIYSGAGGLLPLGLYDARKRAIAADIKKKEALMDQLKEIPDIAKQFKTEYSQEYMNFLSPWLNAYKDKPDQLISNTDFLKDLAHYRSVAENFLKVDSDLRKFEELIQPGEKGSDKGGQGAYATPAMLEILHKFKAGFLPGKTTDWLTGKKNISKLTETVQAIPNGYKWADDRVNKILEKGQAEMPIYPKDGVNWRDPKVKEAAIRDVNGLMVSLKDGSPDYETYLTSLRKYFKFDFDQIAGEWVNGNSLNALSPKEKEEYKKSLATYMLAQMPPDSIINKIDSVANDEAERMSAQLSYQAKMADIAAENWRFQKQFEQHNSATRAQIEAMEESGINETSLKSSEVKINPDNTSDKEYKVWFYTQDSKGNKNFKQDYVSAAEIKRNPNMYFKDNKASSFFTVPETGYFGVNQNVITKEGNNYNGQQYGTMFEVIGKDENGNIYDQSETQWRSRKVTVKRGGVYEKAAEQSYNTSVGQNPAWQAADTEGRGPKTTENTGGGSFVKKNK